MPNKLRTLGCLLLLCLFAAVAHAEVVVVVSARNPVESLSRAALVDIYLGRLNRFPNGEPVVPIDQKDGSPVYTEFYRDYLGQSPAQIKSHWSKLIFTGRGQPPRSFSNGDAVADTVAENPNAIGYLEPDLVDDRLRVVSVE